MGKVDDRSLARTPPVMVTQGGSSCKCSGTCSYGTRIRAIQLALACRRTSQVAGELPL